MTITNPIELRARDFYVNKMLAAFRDDEKILTLEKAPREEPEIWNDVQVDSSFRHSMDFCRKLVIGRTWRVEPFDSTPVNRKIATTYRKMMMKTRNFRRLLFAISEFSIRGESWAYPNFDYSNMDMFGDGNRMSWVIPEEIKHIDRYRIDKKWRESGEIDYYVFSLSSKQWRLLSEDERKNLLYFNNSGEEGSFTHGNAILEAIHWSWYCKKIAESEMLNLAERFGQGMLVAKIKGIKLGSSRQDLEDYKRNVLKLLEFAKGRHAIAIDADEDIKVLDPSSGGYEVLQRQIDYYDNQVRLLCLGANLSVQSVSTGTYAQSRIHENTTFVNSEYNRSIIEEAISNSLFKRLWELNQSQFAMYGLSGGQPPRFVIEAPKEDDVESNLSILLGAHRLGMPIVKEEAYRMLGLTVPVGDLEESLPPPLESVPAPINKFLPVSEQAQVSEGETVVPEIQK